MRTYLGKKLRIVLNWLKLWIISGKKILTAREAALYLKTDVPTIYRLTERYYLPSHKTQKQQLYFKRMEIDAWLKPRRRRDLPQSVKRGAGSMAWGMELGAGSRENRRTETGKTTLKESNVIGHG